MKMMLRKRRLYHYIIWGLLFIILLSVFTAFAAVNSVPSGRMDEDRLSIDPNKLKPPECDFDVVNLISAGTGWTDGTNGNDLILGTNKADRINGLGGSDCIVGGDGNDRLNGDAGDDVILGGLGKDVVAGGEGNDDCYTGGGNDKLSDFDCEDVFNP